MANKVAAIAYSETTVKHNCLLCIYIRLIHLVSNIYINIFFFRKAPLQLAPRTKT